MLRLLVGLVVVVLGSACGAGAGAWVGTWNGTVSVNTGRQPVDYAGSLTISAAGGQATATARGTVGSQTFVCTGLTSSAADDGKLTLAAPATCDFTVTPADTCTYQAVLNQAELSRAGETLTGSGNGRMTITCTGAGGGITDFSMTLTGTRGQ